MPRRGGKRKKTRTHVKENEVAQSALTDKKDEKIPKSLVMRRGRTAHEVGELVDDLRQLMMPYTALHFREDPKNRKLTLSQYATHLALPMGISHLFAFSQNQERLNLRLARTPAGPTLTFRVHRFSLSRHVKALQKRPVAYTASLSTHPPVVVTNNFGDASAAPHIKLLRITFQNLFPAINVATVKLSECRRVVLFNLLEEEVDMDDDEEDENKNEVQTNSNDKDETDQNKDQRQNSSKSKRTRQLVEIRHYCIKATPVGVHRHVRRLVQSKIPNLHKCQDIADYLQGNAVQSDAPSDSEPEDDPSHVVRLPDSYVGKGNNKAQRSALKLVEMGPRLSLELIKVEKDLGSGDVLYHALVQKTPAEAAALKARKEQEAALKTQRRAEQQANVEKKRQAAEAKREAKKQRKADKEEARGGSAVHNQDDEGAADDDELDQEGEDDNEEQEDGDLEDDPDDNDEGEDDDEGEDE